MFNDRQLKLPTLLLACGLLALVGCQGPISTVEGQVTLDGQPLSRGDISFYAPGGALANGAIDVSGRYRIQTGTERGLTPGTYRVVVVANDVILPTEPGGAPMPKLITPAKYSDPATSGFTAEVKPGHNKFDFELKSSP
ncbi:hypothetical protein ETAA8_59120 [Anatilimnocola aggregata]|uniref:Carboxypeptidase regulatory-like domain-containing protein n=1 Tax=Anatilimnocola aggregata TaxID=2528021 RepID=A0A517YKL8_9BACT|nr:carboxypeptidase-like regulatory domain-containing protein [Anatilimnocola aggregata]QDU30764.1 hypothetical protein ETAA8_59120 [Anatilimnocola aggregata]